MMDWSRYLARTAARRVVWIVVGLVVYAVLSMFGVARASNHVTRADAWQHCIAEAQAAASSPAGVNARPPWTNPACKPVVGATAYRSFVTTGSGEIWINQLAGHGRDGQHQWTQDCPAGTEFNEVTGKCEIPCNQRGRLVYRVNHSLVNWRPSECSDGCEYAPSDVPSNCTTITSGANIGNNCWYDAYPTGASCSVPPPEDGRGPDDNDGKCPAGQTQLPDGSCKPQGDCPVGQHKAANGSCQPNGSCPTGQVKGPDGSCNPEGCPAGQAKGKDGTCKDDGDGDGNPDDEGGNSDGKEFSGGDDCKVPPRCSGDAIMCGQARIQWRIDCNTRKNHTLTGGNSCGPGGTPVCTGEKCDPIETAQLVQAWKTACALSEGNGGGTGGGSGNSDVIDYMKGERTGEINALNALNGQGDGLDGVGEGDHWAEPGTGEGGINPNLFGGGNPGMCSFGTSLQLMGKPIELPPEFWQLASWIGWLVVASAYLWIAYRLGT